MFRDVRGVTNLYRTGRRTRFCGKVEVVVVKVGDCPGPDQCLALMIGAAPAHRIINGRVDWQMLCNGSGLRVINDETGKASSPIEMGNLGQIVLTMYIVCAIFSQFRMNLSGL